MEDPPAKSIVIVITNMGESKIAIRVHDNHTDEELEEDATALMIAKGMTGWFADDPEAVRDYGEDTFLDDILEEVPEGRKERPKPSNIYLAFDSDTEGEA
jgi:hypothetical protein